MNERISVAHGLLQWVRMPWQSRLLALVAMAATSGIVALTLSACSGSGGGDSGTTPAAPTLNLDFTRNTSPANGTFKAIVWLSNANGAVVPFSSQPTVSSTRGTVSPLVLRSDGKQEATVTPDAAGSGEYRVTAAASVSGASTALAHTAIVMGQVADGWGQPYSVEGLVNTGGTQDSVAVSPDGQYLFLQYYPVSLSCFIERLPQPGDPNSVACQTATGPIAPPQRPNLPGASRVLSASAIHHGCPSLNFDPSPFPVPPLAMYGFKRQSDGSYAEPFVFAFTHNDGCFSPYGPSVRANGDGTYRMFLAFNDPRNSGTASDFSHLYDFNFTPGATQILGDVSVAGALQINQFVLNPATVGGPDVHRGNPHVHYSGSTPSLLFYDDETQASANQYLHVSQWNGSGWGAPAALNFAPFNTTGNGMTQPYFDGTQLIAREGLELRTFAYNGGPVGSAASWGPPAVLLAPQAAGLQAGSVVVVGEPTVATIAGQEVLFFVYGLRQPDGSLNLRVGFVRKGA